MHPSRPHALPARQGRKLVAFLGALLLAACGGGGGGGEQRPSVSPSINFTPPTDAQLATTVHLWNARDLTTRGATIVHTDTSSPLYVLRVYQHTVGTETHYGAVTIPTLGGTSFPVMVEVDGLDQSNPSMDIGRWLTRNQSYVSRAVVILPVFRGRELRLPGGSWRAGGDFCDAYDGATDDTIALLNVVQANVPAADMTRVLVRGGSRGGTVALLMGQRDRRVKLVAAGSGPVDFYRREVAERYGSQYNCQFITGKTPEQSVQRMLASSPLFYPMLPNVSKVYIDHGDADPVVPVWNATEMASRLQGRGTNVDLQVHAGAVHDLTMYPAWRDRQGLIFDSLGLPQ